MMKGKNMETQILKTQEISGKTGAYNFIEPEPTVDYLTEKIVMAIRESILDSDVLNYYALRDLIKITGITDEEGKPKFFKRLQKAYKASTGNKLPEEFGGIVGNAYKQATTRVTVPLWYQVENDIQNIGGGFGNNGSCWFGYDACYCHAPRILEGSDGVGILIYNNQRQDHEDGIGRIWGVNTPEGIAYFNPYIDLYGSGISRNKVDDIKWEIFQDLIATELMSLKKTARDEYQNLDGKKFVVMETNLDGSRIYVNNNRGAIITDKPEEVSSCYHPFEDSDYSYLTCQQCGKDVDEDEAVYNEDGEPYCESCYEEIFEHCEHCETEIIKRYANQTEEGFICEDCTSEHYTQCSECNVFYKNEDIEETSSGEAVCPTCQERYFYTCEECGAIERNTKANIIQHANYTDSVCDECLEEYTTEEEKLTLIAGVISKIIEDQKTSNYKMNIRFEGSFQTIDRSGKYYKDQDITDIIENWRRNNREVEVISITKGFKIITDKFIRDPNWRLIEVEVN